MENKKVTVTLPCAGLLGIAFVVLRLCGVITWPWVWVLAPFWTPFALAIIIFIVVWILSR